MNADTASVVETLLRSAYRAQNSANSAKTKYEKERLISLASAWRYSAMEELMANDDANSVSAGGLLECQGCEHHVVSLELVMWRDIWDSGETITGSYCTECAAGARDSVAFPNMSARYVSQCECGC